VRAFKSATEETEVPRRGKRKEGTAQVAQRSPSCKLETLCRGKTQTRRAPSEKVTSGDPKERGYQAALHLCEFPAAEENQHLRPPPCRKECEGRGEGLLLTVLYLSLLIFLMKGPKLPLFHLVAARRGERGWPSLY